MGFAYPLVGADTPSVPALIREVGRQWTQARVSDAVATYRQILTIVPDLVECRDNLIMALDLDPHATSADCMAARREWWRQEGFARYLRRQPHTNDRTPDRPLRVGYVSPDWRRHSSAIRNILPVIAGHSAAIEPYCYSTHRWAYDAEDLHTGRAIFRDVDVLTDESLAALIQGDEIDILVDLCGYTAYHSLHAFCRKPAPIQITGFGYATGLGLDAVDVLFSDPIVHGPEPVVERVVHLPSILTYHLAADAPDVNQLPCLKRPPTFAAFHRPQKLNNAVLQLWQRILDAMPGSRILCQHFRYTDDVRAWVRSYLGEAVTFREADSHAAHLAAYHDCDLALDTFPQTGGMTTGDSLAMGVPVVTLIGDRAVQRTSASFMRNVGLFPFIAETPDEYVHTAVAYVTRRRDGLSAIRRTLRAQLLASPICTGYVDAVESAYRSLWQEWCAA